MYLLPLCGFPFYSIKGILWRGKISNFLSFSFAMSAFHVLLKKQSLYLSQDDENTLNYVLSKNFGSGDLFYYIDSPGILGWY